MRPPGFVAGSQEPTKSRSPHSTHTAPEPALTKRTKAQSRTGRPRDRTRNRARDRAGSCNRNLMWNRFCDEIRPENQPRIHVDEAPRRTRRGGGGLSPVAGEAYLAGCALPCARSHRASAHTTGRGPLRACTLAGSVFRPRAWPRPHPVSFPFPSPTSSLLHGCVCAGLSARGIAARRRPAKPCPRLHAGAPGPRRALALFPARQASPEGLFVRLRPRVRTLLGPVCERPNLADQAMPLSGHSHQRYGAPKKNLTPRARSRSCGQMPPNADNCRTFRRAPQRRHPPPPHDAPTTGQPAPKGRFARAHAAP